MFDIAGPIGTLLNFLVIALGFGFIIFVHELGHFVAAKWAGIRVLAFSIGFGQVACSYRKGMGFRVGSSEPDYHKLLRDAEGEDSPERDHARTQLSGLVSPTEYRLSWLPFGGYVKMLGQEDLNPNAVSLAPDSYQNCSIPKRLVVLSAGVAVNVVTAALLFILVFSVGLNIMPPKIGQVLSGSPASIAQPTEPVYGIGLQPGDTVLKVDGKSVTAYRDIATEAAMSSDKRPTPVVILRDGIDQPIEYSAMLKPGAQLGLLDLGVAPLRSTELILTDNLDLWNLRTDEFGLADIPPGSTINTINGQQVQTTVDIQSIASTAESLAVGYTTPQGEAETITLNPQQELMNLRVTIDDAQLEINHILGMTGLMRVHPDVSIDETRQGLMPGDIFIDIAGVAYPSLDAGIQVIRDNKGRPIDIKVLRDDKIIELAVQVSDEGRVGFYPDTTTYSMPIMSRSPSVESSWESGLPNGAKLHTVNNQPILSLDQLSSLILDFVGTQNETGRIAGSYGVPVTYKLAGNQFAEPASGYIEVRNTQVNELRALNKRWPGGPDMSTLFLPVQVVDKADGPIDAIGRGLHESRRVMLQTYITFLRLTQGSVKVEHLKGPVGIAHIGTLIADEGFIKVLFFMALISINLAVINFLPLPIVDGGQCLFLIYEWIRGKPIPIPVQNAITMAGLLLIGSMFLLVTFNDIKSLVGF